MFAIAIGFLKTTFVNFDPFCDGLHNTYFMLCCNLFWSHHRSRIRGDGIAIIVVDCSGGIAITVVNCEGIAIFLIYFCQLMVIFGKSRSYAGP